MKFALLGFCVYVALSLDVNAQNGRKIVAIDKFENEAGAPNEMLQTLRSRIVDNIINTRKFEVVERQRLASVMSERKLAESGYTKDETALEAPALTSAGFILYGSILSLGVEKSSVDIVGVSASKDTIKVEIQLRIANAESGRILSSKTIIATQSQGRLVGDGQKTESNYKEQVIQDAIRDAAKKVSDALTDLVYPAKILKISEADMLVNLTKEQTEIGATYEVFALGEEIFDPDTNEPMGSSEEYAGKIEIIRTMPKFSAAIPVGGKPINSYKVGMIVRRQDEEAIKREKKREKEESTKKFESRF